MLSPHCTYCRFGLTSAYQTGRTSNLAPRLSQLCFCGPHTADRPSCYIDCVARASGALALVALDGGGQPSGVVDRDRLMTRLMKTLATGAS
jgi:hypothetical protein